MSQKTNYQKRIITIPNILSFLRICMIPLIIWLYCVKRSFWGAGLVIVLSGITDMADGFIARRFNMISDFGKVLDPIADKLTQGGVLICLLFSFPLMAIPFAILALKEIFMSITGALVIKKTGNVPSARWHGKAATFLLYCMMLLHVFWDTLPKSLSLASIIICSAVTALSFFLYAAQNLKILKGSGR